MRFTQKTKTVEKKPIFFLITNVLETVGQVGLTISLPIPRIDNSFSNSNHFLEFTFEPKRPPCVCRKCQLTSAEKDLRHLIISKPHYLKWLPDSTNSTIITILSKTGG